MGHTLPPFSQQYKHERALFVEMRRALLRRDDQLRFEALWDKAERHVPAAEKAKHPLPIFSILMSMNLEQEKTIHHLTQITETQASRIAALEEQLKTSQMEYILLKGEIETLLWEMEQMRVSLREELLEIIYPDYVA